MNKNNLKIICLAAIPNLWLLIFKANVLRHSLTYTIHIELKRIFNKSELHMIFEEKAASLMQNTRQRCVLER